jgi:hypothetical protein
MSADDQSALGVRPTDEHASKFRFPSLLWLLYQHKEDLLLARLYEENRRESSIEDGSSYFKIHPIEVLLVEIIISYNLIFGRNWRSRKSIGDIFDKQRLSWEKTGCRDPLLELLCSKDRHCLELQKIYEGLDKDEMKFGPFIQAKEFPFLGCRLLEFCCGLALDRILGA